MPWRGSILALATVCALVALCIAVVRNLLALRARLAETQAALERCEENDALTGMASRARFRQAMRNEIAQGRHFAVACVDLNGFRHVNEREGIHIGDEILVETAARLVSAGQGNLVARLSGNEFGVLIRDVPPNDPLHAAIVPYELQFLRPFHTGEGSGGRVLTVGASIGMSSYPADGKDSEGLLKRASFALDAAKARGGSTTTIFDERMEAEIEERNLRVSELTEGIARDELFLDYQPTLDLATRTFVGAEALVRWNHPTRGRVPPLEFVPFAERNGLITPLTKWVLSRVVRDLSSVSVPSGFRFYINLAPQVLEDMPFVMGMLRLFEETPGLSAHLGVEITETTAMQNVERSVNTLALLREAGITVSIDDFGTGYSSLSYLKQLTVDTIKIDRSFVTGLPGDDRDARLCATLLGISSDFGCTTLAEGVETEAQASWLLDHGCRFAQGYLFARPMPFERLAESIDLPERATA